MTVRNDTHPHILEEVHRSISFEHPSFYRAATSIVSTIVGDDDHIGDGDRAYTIGVASLGKPAGISGPKRGTYRSVTRYIGPMWLFPFFQCNGVVLPPPMIN